MTKLPTIAIVTPSLNQARFLEDTIRSIVDQRYPCLEYVIVDGNSNDGSRDILQKYDRHLTHWVSEPDQGQYVAINKGFEKTSGEIMAWLNADDKYTPWALSVVGDVFANFPQIEWLTSSYALHWDGAGRAVSCRFNGQFSREGFFRGENLPDAGWHARGWIQQESTFWRRSLWERAGSRIDPAFPLAGDFELWARFYQLAPLYAVGTPLGGFRLHKDQKTASQSSEYVREAVRAFRLHGGQPPGRIRSFFLSALASSIRNLQKQYARKSKFVTPQYLCLHKGREGGWRIKSQ